MLTRTLSRLAVLTARNSAQLLCVALLVAACASASLVFACAAPFAAFAVLAAAVMPLRSAVAAIGVVWLANQAIGFGLLGYPRTLDAAAWGLVLGIAAAIATVVATALFHRLAHLGRLAIYPLALVASFASYELCLLAATPVLGGAGAFAVDIVGQIALVNAVWLAGLVAVYEGARRFEGLARPHALR